MPLHNGYAAVPQSPQEALQLLPAPSQSPPHPGAALSQTASPRMMGLAASMKASKLAFIAAAPFGSTVCPTSSLTRPPRPNAVGAPIWNGGTRYGDCDGRAPPVVATAVAVPVNRPPPQMPAEAFDLARYWGLPHPSILAAPSTDTTIQQDRDVGPTHPNRPTKHRATRWQPPMFP